MNTHAPGGMNTLPTPKSAAPRLGAEIVYGF